MGCSGSKAAEVASEPFPAGNADASAHVTARNSAHSPTNEADRRGNGLGPCAAQAHGPGTILRKLGSGIHETLAELHSLDVLTYSQAEDQEVALLKASACIAAVDRLLDPLVHKLPDAVSRGDGARGWGDIQLAELAQLVRGAVEAQALRMSEAEDKGGARKLNIKDGIVKALAAISRLESSLRGGLGDEAPQSAGLSRLWGLIGAVACREVAVSSQATYQRLKDDAFGVCEAVGATMPACAGLLSSAAKCDVLYLAAGAAQQEGKASLVVRRGSAFRDLVAALWPRARDTGLARCKLLPAFVDAALCADGAAADADAVREAGEGHGPRKEFFSMVGEALCAEGGVLEYVQGSESYWVSRSPAKRSDGEWWMAGWIMGQCLANRCSLGKQISPVLIRALRQGPEWEPSLRDLNAVDAATAHGIRQAADLAHSDPVAFAEIAEAAGVPGDVPAGVFALVSTHHALVPPDSGAAPRAKGGADGLQLMSEGFVQALGGTVGLELMAELAVGDEDVCEGVSGARQHRDGDFPVLAYFHLAPDEELRGCPELLEALRVVVEALEPPMKRKLLAFVTGTDRLPRPGTELLRAELPFVALSEDERAAQLCMLPQAHTCSNTLELPNYWEALQAAAAAALSPEPTPAALREVLRERLETAVLGTAGYDLDD
ncbi:unnamed protein product [Pedinophyceae sp. YPF-701]|nr:unnamed protein product [Pedinophyceae sp. YPF-701]